MAAGEALINGTQNATSQGAYECLNDATVNLAIAASDPTNPRIDIVVAQVRDAAYSGASNDWIPAVVTGTPAPSPSPPAMPANAIVLAQEAVAANATSIVSGDITDKRLRLGTLFRARAKNTSNTAVSTSITKIALQSTDYDPNGNFDAVTNFQYTAPVPGYYLIIVKLLFTGISWTGQEVLGFIFKNGAALDKATQSIGTVATAPAFTLAGIYLLTRSTYGAQPAAGRRHVGRRE